MQNTTNTPVAPVVGTQGTSTPGGHFVAYKACPAFAPDATLKLISASNPWRPNTPGHNFYVKVLALQPATVAAMFTLAAKAGIKQGAAMAHLRWLYTWGGSYVQVNGKVFAAPVAAPVAAKAKKAKATA